MFNRSIKTRTTPQEIARDVKRAVSALKSAQTTLNVENVAKQAHMYNKLSLTAIKRYIAGLTEQQCIEHGYPDPNAKKPKLNTRPNLSVAFANKGWGKAG